jgi:hypothetical protein
MSKTDDIGFVCDIVLLCKPKFVLPVLKIISKPILYAEGNTLVVPELEIGIMGDVQLSSLEQQCFVVEDVISAQN